MTASKVALAGLAIGVLFSANMGSASAKAVADKIPGSKTFGNVAMTGLALGAIGHYTGFGGRLRPYLKAAGFVGIAAAALKLGTDNTGFKWLGDDDYDQDQIMDVDTD